MHCLALNSSAGPCMNYSDCTGKQNISRRMFTCSGGCLPACLQVSSTRCAAAVTKFA